MQKVYPDCRQGGPSGLEALCKDNKRHRRGRQIRRNKIFCLSGIQAAEEHRGDGLNDIHS